MERHGAGAVQDEFEALYSGGEGEREDGDPGGGDDLKPGTFNTAESQYLEGGKLTRVGECARAYHIPLPMVGILDMRRFEFQGAA